MERSLGRHPLAGQYSLAPKGAERGRSFQLNQDEDQRGAGGEGASVLLDLVSGRVQRPGAIPRVQVYLLVRKSSFLIDPKTNFCNSKLASTFPEEIQSIDLGPSLCVLSSSSVLSKVTWGGVRTASPSRVE